MTEFLVLEEVRVGEQQICYIGLQRGYFGLLRRLNERVPWEAIMRHKGIQEG